MMVVREWLYDRVRACLAGERLTRCPDDVGLHNVGSWLLQRYGPSTDASWIATGDGGNVLVGWVFPVPHDWLTERSGVQEMVAVPMVADDLGVPTVPAFLHHAQRARQGSQAAGEAEDSRDTIRIRAKVRRWDGEP